ncbi:MAG: phosphopentomutase, partial [Clostridiales bacterium]
MTVHKRFIIIVLDSLGVGALPDAAAFGAGDTDANTLAHIAANTDLAIPNL